MVRAVENPGTWPDGIMQLLDDHHVVVLCDEHAARRSVAGALRQRLESLGDTRVIELEGSRSQSLDGFFRELERHVPKHPHEVSLQESPVVALTHPGSGRNRTGPIASTLWDPTGYGSLAQVFRDRLGRCLHKREYVIWHDADVMLEHDVALFGALVNALLGVAAEREHISLDRLLLQRIVFLGGEKLGAYAEDPNGQFSRWLEDPEGSPLWEVMSVLLRPPVLTYRVNG
jgi:hypothetical protein